MYLETAMKTVDNPKYVRDTRGTAFSTGQLGVLMILAACTDATTTVAVPTHADLDDGGTPDIAATPNIVNVPETRAVGDERELTELIDAPLAEGAEVSVDSESVSVTRDAGGHYVVDFSALPAGEQTVVFSVRGANGQVSEYHVRVDIDPVPVFDSLEKAWSITRGEDFAITLPEVRDDDPVTLSVDSLPSGWAFDEESRVLSGRYDGDASALELRYVADDGTSTVVRTLDLEVEEPTPLVLPEGTIAGIVGDWQDVDGDTLAYTLDAGVYRVFFDDADTADDATLTTRQVEGTFADDTGSLAAHYQRQTDVLPFYLASSGFILEPDGGRLYIGLTITLTEDGSPAVFSDNLDANSWSGAELGLTPTITYVHGVDEVFIAGTLAANDDGEEVYAFPAYTLPQSPSFSEEIAVADMRLFDSELDVHLQTRDDDALLTLQGLASAGVGGKAAGGFVDITVADDDEVVVLDWGTDVGRAFVQQVSDDDAVLSRAAGESYTLDLDKLPDDIVLADDGLSFSFASDPDIHYDIDDDTFWEYFSPNAPTRLEVGTGMDGSFYYATEHADVSICPAPYLVGHSDGILWN